MLLCQSGPVALLPNWWPARRPGPCLDEPSRPPGRQHHHGGPRHPEPRPTVPRPREAACGAAQGRRRRPARLRGDEEGHGSRQLSIAVAPFVGHHKLAGGKYWASMEDGMLVFGVGPAY